MMPLRMASAIAMLLLFLRKIRPTGIVALAIPVSIIGTFLAMTAFGRNLNVVSLAGLAFAVGMVVDSAIVEHHFRKRDDIVPKACPFVPTSNPLARDEPVAANSNKCAAGKCGRVEFAQRGHLRDLLGRGATLAACSGLVAELLQREAR